MGNTRHLKAKYIRSGIIELAARNPQCYVDVLCPICGEMIAELADERGGPGKFRFVDDAFMVSPCKKLDCRKAQIARQERLDDNEELTLYHQTSEETAKLIYDASG